MELTKDDCGYILFMLYKLSQEIQPPMILGSPRLLAVYYMVTWRGPNSLMDRHLSCNAVLSPEILQFAIMGLMTLHEVELNQTHHFIFGLRDFYPCSTPNCPSHAPTDPAASEAYWKVFNYIVGCSRLGTNLLQVPKFHDSHESDVQGISPDVCGRIVEKWETGYTELRKKG